MLFTKRCCLIFLGLFTSILGQAKIYAPVLDFRIAPTVDRNTHTRTPTVSIPFSFEKKVPIVKVDINGSKNEYFLIDSGAARTLLNSNQAPRLKILLSNTNLGPLPGSGDSDEQLIKAAKSVALKLDGTLILKGDIPAVSLAQLSKDLDLRITGIIGYDILSAHQTKIDYVHRQFSVFKDKEAAARLDEQSIVFRVENNSPLPIISTEIGIAEQNLGAARILIDTGFQRAMMISPRFGLKYQLEKLNGWKMDRGSGIGGEFAYIYGLPGWIAFGGKNFIVPSMSVSQAQSGIFTKNFFDAIIGGSILSNYEITFNVHEGIIVLRGAVPVQTNNSLNIPDEGGTNGTGGRGAHA